MIFFTFLKIPARDLFLLSSEYRLLIRMYLPRSDTTASLFQKYYFETRSGNGRLDLETIWKRWKWSSGRKFSCLCPLARHTSPLPKQAILWQNISRYMRFPRMCLPRSDTLLQGKHGETRSGNGRLSSKHQQVQEPPRALDPNVPAEI